MLMSFFFGNLVKKYEMDLNSAKWIHNFYGSISKCFVVFSFSYCFIHVLFTNSSFGSSLVFWTWTIAVSYVCVSVCSMVLW